MLETMDYQFEDNSVAEEHPELDRSLSEYFARRLCLLLVRVNYAKATALQNWRG